MDQNALQQITERLKQANNVLVTVSTNPSVDQLAACIGFTLLLNHLGKHGTAVFSGDVPSTIEFLKPEETLEKNTDSLRDFIIALDKSKADKLRYKVEDKVVKIFITPYRTSLSDKDLEFSQGDFNVDAVMALGVHERADLDKAIMDHGRILHDATVISVNNKNQGNLGAINWINLQASSLSEMMTELARNLSPKALDPQMATAFMTGIVAETNRFSNNKTSPRTMALASELMGAGANQQLIASKLEATATTAQDIPEDTGKTPAKTTGQDDGSLEISHEDKLEETPKNEGVIDKLEAPDTSDITNKDQEINDVLGTSEPEDNKDQELLPVTPLADQATSSNSEPAAGMPSRASMALEPPSMGGQLTANSQPEHLQTENSTDPLTLPSVDSETTSQPILNRPTNLAGTPIQPASSSPAPISSLPVADDSSKTETVEEAREAVDQAIASDSANQPLDPIQALGAQPVNLDLGNAPAPQPSAPAPAMPVVPEWNPAAAPPAVSTTGLDVSPPAPEPAIPSVAPPEINVTPTVVSAPAPSMPSAVPLPPPNNPGVQPFGAPPDLNGVNPNLPTNLVPPAQPFDATAGVGSPTPPPPVPPPLMPPSDAV